MNAQNADGVDQYNATIARCNGQYVTQTPDIPTGTTPTAPSYHHLASFAFITSRPGGTLYPGDTWTINITGGLPGLMVTTWGYKDSNFYARAMKGRLDGSGNFSLSGTVAAGDVGSYQETWEVDTNAIGQANFVVATPSSGQANPPVGTGAGAGSSSSGSSSSNGGSGGSGAGGNTGGGTTPPSVGGTDGGLVSLIPNFGGMSNTELIGIGVVVVAAGYFMLKK